MRRGLTWGNVSYIIEKENGEFKEFNRVSCFTFIRDYIDKSPLKYITLLDINCKVTFEYRDFYLQYINDMLNLESEILDNGFKFKASEINCKNLLILSLLRFLFENIGYKTPHINIVNSFLKPLKENNCKYTDKLARFCYFYSLIPQGDYFNTGHSWKPKDTEIKYTKDYLECTDLRKVNSFFEK